MIAKLSDGGALDYSVIMVAEGNEAPGLSYVAPYGATSIAEAFMQQGRDVLIVYDDLTHHARSYRELSLLLRRPPGREAYPGDIFYLHSRLLERSTHLAAERGGGSLTALPIVETEAQDLAAYIPTNLISITDGQIYLSPTLFELGSLPAIDVGQSVSRVGGAAQRAAYRTVAGDLKLSYSQFLELETFARFGTRLDEPTRRVIEHGRRIRECLKQRESQALVAAPASSGTDGVGGGPFRRNRARHGGRGGKSATRGSGRHAAGHCRALRIRRALERRRSTDRVGHCEPRAEALCARDVRAPRGADMSGAAESLSRQIGGAKDLSSIVRSMKALAASSVGQYERAVDSLRDYSRTVELALSVCLRELGGPTEPPPRRRAPAGIVVIGSDQGLVGRFNEVLVDFLGRGLEHAPDRIAHVWAVGARIEQLLPDADLPPPTMLGLPYSVEAITPLVAALPHRPGASPRLGRGR